MIDKCTKCHIVISVVCREKGNHIFNTEDLILDFDNKKGFVKEDKIYVFDIKQKTDNENLLEILVDSENENTKIKLNGKTVYDNKHEYQTVDEGSFLKLLKVEHSCYGSVSVYNKFLKDTELNEIINFNTKK